MVISTELFIVKLSHQNLSKKCELDSYTSLIPWTVGFFTFMPGKQSEEIKITSPINFSPYALY